MVVGALDFGYTVDRRIADFCGVISCGVIHIYHILK